MDRNRLLLAGLALFTLTFTAAGVTYFVTIFTSAAKSPDPWRVDTDQDGVCDDAEPDGCVGQSGPFIMNDGCLPDWSRMSETDKDLYGPGQDWDGDGFIGATSIVVEGQVINLLEADDPSSLWHPDNPDEFEMWAHENFPGYRLVWGRIDMIDPDDNDDCIQPNLQYPDYLVNVCRDAP